jgi:hypothetical protein
MDGDPIDIPIDSDAMVEEVKKGAEKAKKSLENEDPVPLAVDTKKLKEDISDAVSESTEDTTITPELDTSKVREQASGMSDDINNTVEKNPAEVTVKPDKSSFARVRRMLKDLAKKIVVHVEAKASKSSTTHMAQGGRIPGPSSKQDTVPVMARRGEWFIRNEAAGYWEKAFGNNFMNAVNNPNSSIGQKLKDAVISGMRFVRMSGGGQVIKLATPSTFAAGSGQHRDMGVINFTIGKETIPIRENVDVLTKLKRAVVQELRMRPN